MKELRFENLYSPEYYFEIPGYDCRIAILKFIEARDTMGMAAFSLSYIDDSTTDDLEKNFAKIIHLRHAIEDLNNSFDLLMQIPWFFYRIWNEYNSTGSLKDNKLNNYNEIIRNSPNWVNKAENECNKEKVIKYLISNSNPLKQKIETFFNKFIDKKKSRKPFTVRSLCNDMKHKHALSFEELYIPYDFFLNINGEKTNLTESNIEAEYNYEIVDETQQQVGYIKCNYVNDLSVDFEYTNGDFFCHEDCAQIKRLLKISNVYKECCDYYDALVDLFEDIYNEIYPQITFMEFFLGKDKKPIVNVSKGKIDLNKYFTIA